MKFTATFKNPDALIIGIQESLKDLKVEGLSLEETEELKETRESEALDICGKWFEYDEYIKVEVDTELKTCTVLEVEEDLIFN